MSDHQPHAYDEQELQEVLAEEWTNESTILDLVATVRDREATIERLERHMHRWRQHPDWDYCRSIQAPKARKGEQPWQLNPAFNYDKYPNAEMMRRDWMRPAQVAKDIHLDTTEKAEEE